MTAVIEKRLGDIETLCHRLGVRRLAVFGSGVRGDFDEATSDLDFVVEFVPMSPREHKDSFFSLLEGLERLLSHPVDLVEFQALTNPFVRSRIEAEQETVFDAA